MKLKGIGASAGTFAGRVRVYSHKERKNIKKLDVIVLESVFPDMDDEIFNAGAVLSERGGLLSHIAILCREFSIPCIVGVKNLTKTVKDGDYVKLNGSKGIIEVGI